MMLEQIYHKFFLAILIFCAPTQTNRAYKWNPLVSIPWIIKEWASYSLNVRNMMMVYNLKDKKYCKEPERVSIFCIMAVLTKWWWFQESARDALSAVNCKVLEYIFQTCRAILLNTLLYTTNRQVCVKPRRG